MIYKLRRKFIIICILSFAAVFTVLYISIFCVTAVQTNKSLDMLADIISSNGGKFPQWNNSGERPGKPAIPDGLNMETPFSTRFFTVRFDKEGYLVFADIGSIASVSRSEAAEYANAAVKKSLTRGWIKDFRYKVINTEDGITVIFINGTDERQSNNRFMMSSVLVFGACSIIVIALIVLVSGKAVKPAAESYEKQKQFITDANHELKTPLTLIRTNLDIMESEIGPNEWLTDIKEESRIMTKLVNHLVTLARTDEENTELRKELFSLSDAVSDTVMSFALHIEKSEKRLFTNIPENILLNGDEGAIRQLVSILMDNALKYCDTHGAIFVTLCGGKHPVIAIDNSYLAVNTIPLDKLFDRFYRADKARSCGSGFGIGLSIAKGIAEKHHGQIKAINLNGNTIRFKVNL